MLRLILPIILIVISIVGFFTFTDPLYQDITTLRAESASYNEALTNSKALENERDKLVNKSNSIDPENLSKLEKLLPDNVDNIRAILEMEKVAMPFGMQLRDVHYDTLKQDAAAAAAAAQNGGGITGGVAEDPTKNRDYGTWTLGFSTQGTYNNLLLFLSALEKNLRIIDIASVDFSSEGGSGINPGFTEVYKYSFKLKTYWLKN